MSNSKELKVLFCAGFGPIVKDPGAAKKLYAETLGLPMEQLPDNPDYLHTEKLAGVKHLALWPLNEAAKSCFGKDTWPKEVPEPSAWMEFDVEDVAVATSVLKSRGYRLLVETRTEPWGQVVTRMLSPEGILIGITLTPWMR